MSSSDNGVNEMSGDGYILTGLILIILGIMLLVVIPTAIHIIFKNKKNL